MLTSEEKFDFEIYSKKKNWTTLGVDKPHLADRRRFNSPMEPSADMIIRYFIGDFSSFR